MTDYTRISIVRPSAKPAATMVVFADSGLTLGPRTEALGIGEVVAAAAAAGRFKGKLHSTLDILAPAVEGIDRIVVVGVGTAADLGEGEWLALGGDAMGALSGSGAATVMLERPDDEPVAPDMAAQFALGMKLRGYVFDDYLTGANATDSQERNVARIRIAVAESGKAKSAWEAAEAVGEGVLLARDLVNLPPNILGPVEFADRAKELSKLGVEVEVLTEAQMKRRGMRALLGVAQGSPRPPRLVVMRWNGGKDGEAPVAFVGKGVVFDTGGISLKPGQGMQDMKGDMAGAAAVTGLMAALAGRKAKANVVGVIGLVENMPDGNAQRPGDIVTAMTGRTIEIINTDAEGRLVLADAVAHTERTFKPRLMVDLATLTGAIIVALGHHYAGMFANDDGLAETLAKAGQATGERVWRMPLDDAYDRSINSQFANVKNAGGRDAGSITAAHFIKRFVDDTPWAHLDIAGTGFGSPQTAVNRSWASGFGVRLLDRFVADNHE